MCIGPVKDMHTPKLEDYRGSLGEDLENIIKMWLVLKDEYYSTWYLSYDGNKTRPVTGMEFFEAAWKWFPFVWKVQCCTTARHNKHSKWLTEQNNATWKTSDRPRLVHITGIHMTPDVTGRMTFMHQLNLYVHSMLERQIRLYESLLRHLKDVFDSIGILSTGHLPPLLFPPTVLQNKTAKWFINPIQIMSWQ